MFQELLFIGGGGLASLFVFPEDKNIVLIL